MYKPTFADLELATYFTRKLYYRRRESDPPPLPPDVAQTRDLAHRYVDLLESGGVNSTPERSSSADFGRLWPSTVIP